MLKRCLASNVVRRLGKTTLSRSSGVTTPILTTQEIRTTSKTAPGTSLAFHSPQGRRKNKGRKLSGVTIYPNSLPIPSQEGCSALLGVTASGTSTSDIDQRERGSSTPRHAAPRRQRAPRDTLAPFLQR